MLTAERSFKLAIDYHPDPDVLDFQCEMFSHSLQLQKSYLTFCSVVSACGNGSIQSEEHFISPSILGGVRYTRHLFSETMIGSLVSDLLWLGSGSNFSFLLQQAHVVSVEKWRLFVNFEVERNHSWARTVPWTLVTVTSRLTPGTQRDFRSMYIVMEHWSRNNVYILFYPLHIYI